MALDFSDLEKLVQQSFDIPLTEVWQDKTAHFQSATLEELQELLTEAVEPYRSLKSRLPADLRQSALQEIAFFEQLFQLRLQQARASARTLTVA